VQKSPKNHTSETLWETYEKLKTIEKLLKKLNLYNTKYLLCRNGYYYFTLKIKDSVYKKSLKTTNLTYAIILREKIKWRLSNMIERDNNLKDKFQVSKSEGGISIIAENETERKLLDEMQNTVLSKISRLKKEHNEIIEEDLQSRKRITIKKVCEDFIELKKDINLAEKQIIKYYQALDYLIVYFGEKKAVKDITALDANEFRNFLLRVPKNYKAQALLKGKNIKALIDKKSKILDKFERQQLSTIEEVIKKIKAMFNDFENKGYIVKNPFNRLTKIEKKTKRTSWKEFKEEDLVEIIKYTKQKSYEEAYNFIMISLFTGLRRGETLGLQVKDIDLKKMYIDVDGTKTDNAKRIVLIHRNIEDILKNVVASKSRNDYLFFNGDKLPNGSELNPKYRDDRIGAYINDDIIGEVIPSNVKKHYNIHSFRKNFAQEVYLSGLFGDIDFKTILGHSTDGDTSDYHYIMGKRNYKLLKEKLDKVDFSHYLP
jgi:integrase